MNQVEVEEDFLSDTIKVRVNGQILKDRNGKDCTFQNTFAAAIAGAKEVDRQKATAHGKGK
jgi:hypothetical protein